MKFLIGALIFVAVFSSAKTFTSSNDLDVAALNIAVAQATATRNSTIEGIYK